MKVDDVVSRETLHERLASFEREFARWAPRINLVSRSERSTLDRRHIDDSLQLLDGLDAVPRSWVDLGSGGGFPGLIVAAALPDGAVTLVESNAKKAAFLRSAALAMRLDVCVRSERIETVVPTLAPPEIVSARALAPLTDLLRMTAPWLAEGSLGIFPKGQGAVGEIATARTHHDFGVAVRPSRTASDASIVQIMGYRPHSAAFLGSDEEKA